MRLPRRRRAPVSAAVCLILAASLVAAGGARAATYVATKTMATGGGTIETTITIDDTAGTLDIEMTGPNTRWLAIGMDSSLMGGTYTIVTYPAGSAEERTLGNHSAGSPLSPQNITLDIFTPNGDGTSTFAISRALDPGDPDAYVFPADPTVAPIPFIWAVGQGASFSYHGAPNKNGGNVTFESDATAADEPSVREMSWGMAKFTFRRVD
jgi:hypothetical protein